MSSYRSNKLSWIDTSCVCRQAHKADNAFTRFLCALNSLVKLKTNRLHLGTLEVEIPDELMDEYVKLRNHRLCRLSVKLSPREIEIINLGLNHNNFNNWCHNAYDFRRLLSA
jgi:hypothetical protein